MPLSNASLLSQCFELLYPVRHEFTTRFYARLFAKLPETREMFSIDPRRREMMLFAVISMILKGVESGRDLEPEMHQFGRLHARADVQDEHFPIFGSVFLETLQDALPDWDQGQLANAWWDVYTTLYEAMAEGMAAERANMMIERAASSQLRSA